ncbi:class I SAM-dependent methyltransferase [Puia dinghuensis]|uniref:class I SAM-dependent methyltransferase n=1 Tax=Puia dinghuensis TaxID=1792502 RepID=UPI00166C916D|nr:class I SAM-dependent methyltransferase [Puia dinghuensis]
MHARHVYDPDFTNCSSGLKKILTDSNRIFDGCCIDIPCGTGRNTFLLASYFKKVIGVDINETYLNILKDSYFAYSGLVGSISTQRMDITVEMPGNIKQADLISTIHYYSFSFASKVISEMRPGAFFYMESPSCAGENFRELPNAKEVEFLLKGMEVLLLKTNICGATTQNIKSVSFKFLLKKSNG